MPDNPLPKLPPSAVLYLQTSPFGFVAECNSCFWYDRNRNKCFWVENKDPNFPLTLNPHGYCTLFSPGYGVVGVYKLMGD